jgi:hypothetical protein
MGLILYFILYLSCLFSVVPLETYFPVLVLFIILILFIFAIIYYILKLFKHRIISMVIFNIINCGFFLIAGEIANVSLSYKFFYILISSIFLNLSLVKNSICKKIGLMCLFVLLLVLIENPFSKNSVFK